MMILFPSGSSTTAIRQQGLSIPSAANSTPAFFRLAIAVHFLIQRWSAAAAWISHIEGSYSGIMGLPLFETAQLLGQAGVRY